MTLETYRVSEQRTEEPLVTAAELAEVLGLAEGTVRNKWERGEIPGYRLGPRKGAPVRFRVSEVLDRFHENAEPER